jgi:diadenosine tetraphosphate (Ap4A) HIT family hydrolase
LSVVSAGFRLDEAFVSSSRAVGDLGLCHVRLQDDARYAWLVLIPRLGGLSELEDLCEADRARFMQEVVLCGKAVRAMGLALGRPIDKLNFGALGNVTAQLHGHVVGRRRDDSAWPRPVWGQGQAIPYSGQDLQSAMTAARHVLSQAPDFSSAPD